MAQRTIHYLLGELLKDEHIKDINRFRIGSILPDAYIPTGIYPDTRRQTTHFEEYIDGKIHYRYDLFVEQFKEHMDDDLYIGYYMHLVEDMYWRQFWSDYGMALAKDMEDIHKVHHDYHMMNEYIVNTYHIKDEIIRPTEFEQEAICDVFAYTIDKILDDFQIDCSEHVEGEFTYLTPEKLDAFIKNYFPKIKEAYDLIRKGELIPSLVLSLY